MTEANLKAAQDVHHKLEFYLVALVFTALVFAIQSAKFTVQVLPDITEIMAWLALLVSGLLGLRRIEYIPVLYRTGDAVRFHDRHASERSLERAQRPDLAKRMDANDAKFEELRELVRRMETFNYGKYFWQKSCLVGGFVVLWISRAWPHVQQLLTSC